MNKYMFMIVLLVLIIAGWSAAWLYGREILSERLEAERAGMARYGTELTCAQLVVAGYPFRYEVRCADLDAAGKGATGSLGSLNAVALIYNPRHIILEASPPFSVSLKDIGETAQILWDTARASVRFGENGVGKVDVVVTGPDVTASNPFAVMEAVAEKAELHLRPVPEASTDLDGFLSADGLRTPVLPTQEASFDLRAHVRLKNGMALLAGADAMQLRRMAGGVLPLELVLFELKTDASMLTASGDLQVNPDGTLSGTLDLALSQPDRALDIFTPLMPPGNTAFAAADGLFKSLKPSEKDAAGAPVLRLPMVVDRGVMRIGFLVLGTLPPVLTPLQ